MKRGLTLFLQVVIGLIGIGALAFLLWEPHVEGRNVHATFFEVYFKDPFLAYAYVASITFFVALYQAIKVLGYAGQNRIFTPEAVHAVRRIRFCAIALIGLAVVSVAFMPLGDPEDRPPGVVMRAVVVFGSVAIATAAAMFERAFNDGMGSKNRV